VGRRKNFYVFLISWLGFTESRKDASKSLHFFTKQTRKQKGRSNKTYVVPRIAKLLKNS
jgi:hypothetical protein